jgi:hypothetical protein
MLGWVHINLRFTSFIAPSKLGAHDGMLASALTSGSFHKGDYQEDRHYGLWTKGKRRWSGQ